MRYALMDEHTFVAQKELNSTVLADGLFFSGRLRREAIDRTVEAVAAFCKKAKAQNADEILLFATEAVRAASNGKEFTDAVFARTGITVDVIDGVTEALVGFMGATPDQKISAAVFDIGGASCEIICGKESEITYAKSAPVGCIRLRDGAGGSRTQAERLVADALDVSFPAVETVVGIGGTATALGAMAHCPQAYDPHTVHGATVRRDFLEETARAFFAGEDLLSRFPCLTPARSRIVGYGAVAALRVLTLLRKDEFTVSERDNMEGYAAWKSSQKNI